MTIRIDVDSLETLVAVVDSGGFTAAGDRLGRTQSAISAKIAGLERLIGKRLLERSRGGAQPTEAGLVLLGYARRLLALEDEARSAMTGRGLEGRVRLGMPDDYVEVFGTPVIARFTAANPRVHVEVRCELSVRLEKEMERGAFDVAVITRDVERPTGELLRREPVIWCAPPDHRPELIDPLPLVLFAEGCRERPHIFAALDAARRPWRVAYASSSLSGVVSAAVAGLGMTALINSAVPPGWRRLSEAEGLPPLPELEMALLVQEHASLPARKLAEELRCSMAGA